MVVHLSPSTPWHYELPEDSARAEVTFASASASEDGVNPLVEVRFNDSLFDAVTLRAPHSWWTNAHQPFCPPIGRGDVLAVTANGHVDLRIDILEHEA